MTTLRSLNKIAASVLSKAAVIISAAIIVLVVAVFTFLTAKFALALARQHRNSRFRLVLRFFFLGFFFRRVAFIICFAWSERASNTTRSCSRAAWKALIASFAENLWSQCAVEDFGAVTARIIRIRTTTLLKQTKHYARYLCVIIIFCAVAGTG